MLAHPGLSLQMQLGGQAAAKLTHIHLTSGAQVDSVAPGDLAASARMDSVQRAILISDDFASPKCLQGPFLPIPHCPSGGTQPQSNRLAWPSAAGGTDAGKRRCVMQLPAARHVQTYPQSAVLLVQPGNRCTEALHKEGLTASTAQPHPPLLQRRPPPCRSAFTQLSASPAITLPPPRTPSSVFAPSLPKPSHRGALHRADGAAAPEPHASQSVLEPQGSCAVLGPSLLRAGGAFCNGAKRPCGRSAARCMQDMHRLVPAAC